MFRLMASILWLAFSLPSLAKAAPIDWQWNDPGSTGFYSGNISLYGTGGSQTSTFNRYSGGVTPNMNTDTVSTPPVLLMASMDIDFKIGKSGVAVAKKSCPSPMSLQVYATPVTVCDSGTANNIQGFHVDAVDNGTSFTPRLFIYVAGTGWKQVVNNECGRLEVKQFCQ